MHSGQMPNKRGLHHEGFNYHYVCFCWDWSFVWNCIRCSILLRDGCLRRHWNDFHNNLHFIGYNFYGYSYVSGKETSLLFEKFGDKIENLGQQINRIEEQSTKLGKQIEAIEDQNRSLVEKTKVELSKENYGQANIDSIRKKDSVSLQPNGRGYGPAVFLHIEVH